MRRSLSDPILLAGAPRNAKSEHDLDETAESARGGRGGDLMTTPNERIAPEETPGGFAFVRCAGACLPASDRRAIPDPGFMATLIS